MKKLLIGVAVVLLVAAAGAPYVNGIVMERAIKHSSKDVNTMYGEMGNGVSLEIVKYDRGYLSSEITWKIHFGELRRFYGVKEMEVVETAKHGLAGVVMQTNLKQNKWYADFVQKKLGGKDPLHITTHYRLFGKFRTDFVLDGFSLPVEKDTVAVKPLDMHITVSQNLKEFSTRGSWQGLTVPGKASVGEFSVNGKLKKVSTFIYDGGYTFALKSIESFEGKKPIKMTNLKADYTMKYDNKAHSLGFDISYGVDSISDKRENAIDDAHVRFGVDKLDAKGYEEFIKAYMSAFNTAMKSGALAQKDPRKQKQFMQTQMGLIGLQMMTVSQKVLKKGLKFRIDDLRAKLPQGKISGEFALALKQDITFPQLGMVAQNPAVALQLFSLHSAISLPAKLAGANAAKLTSPLFPGMKTGLFVKQGDTLVNKADTEDGKLILNGQEVSL